jgi:hypothetical protein
MKKLLLTIPLFLILPLSALAATIDFGNWVGDRLNFSVSNCANMETGGVLLYGMLDVEPFDGASCTPEESGLFIPNTPYKFIEVLDEGTCSTLNYPDILLDECFVIENVYTTPALTIAEKSGVLFGRSGESQTAIQSGGSMLAAVGLVSTSTFSGLFPYLILSVGVFVSFYIIQQLVMFLGREKLKKKK